MKIYSADKFIVAGGLSTQYLMGDGSLFTGSPGTVTNVSELLIGSSGTDVTSSVTNGSTTPVITINIPTASATNRGALSSTDWSTFNNKQNALTNPVTGTGTSGYISFWNGTGTQIGSSNLFWDNTNKYLGIGTISPQTQLHVNNSATVGIVRIQGVSDTDNYSVLELWDATGSSKWQFAHKSYATQTKDFSFAHWNGTSWITPLLIKDNGNILIGTSSDSGDRLRVNGTVRLDSLASASTKMVIVDTNGVLSTQVIPSGGGDMMLGTDQTVTSLKTFVNSTNPQTNGLHLTNDGSTGSQVLRIVNTSTGVGSYMTNSLAGGTALSILSTAGTGISSTANGFAIAVSLFNSGSGNAITASNTGSGTSMYFYNSSTGKNLVLNNSTSATGIPFTIQKNAVDKLTINDSGDIVTSGNLQLKPIADPAPPTTGLLHYAKSIAGRVLPKIVGPSGIDTIMQVGLHGNSVFMVGPSNATTAPTTWGGAITTATTISHQQTIASANPWLATRRTRFTTAATALAVSGMRTAYVQWFRGNAAGFGGFWFRCQFGMNLNLSGGQKFIGLCALTTALAGEPSALLNMCGMGYDSGDLLTSNWFFMYNDGSGTATKIDLGSNAVRSTTVGYDLIMYMAPNSSELFVRIVNIATNILILDTSYTSLLPSVDVGMAFKAEVRTGATSADSIEIAKVYIETDY